MQMYKTQWLTIAIFLTLGVAACDKPVSAEKTGAQIDQAVENANDKIDAAKNKASDKLNAVADNAVNKIDAATEKVNIEAAKTRLALEDAAITAKIKANILAEPGLKSFDVFVNTFDGIVTLTGTVNSEAQRAKANYIAQVATGVKGVDNQIIIK